MASSASNNTASISTPFGIGNNDSPYDVSIIHSGSDVRASFVSHLHDRLAQEGLRTFLYTVESGQGADIDTEELGQGAHILTPQRREPIGTPQLQTLDLSGATVLTQLPRFEELRVQSVFLNHRAEASHHIAIISHRFIQSWLCIDVLIKMLGSQCPIITVLYGISPTDIRARARSLSKLGYDAQTIERWRAALEKVALERVFQLEAYNRDYAALLKVKVIQEVFKTVRICVPTPLAHELEIF